MDIGSLKRRGVVGPALAGAAGAAGVAARLVVSRGSQHLPQGEAGNVAHAIASGRGFSDALFAGEGPTAHLLPVTPMIAGGMWSIFGIDRLGGFLVQLLASLYCEASFALAALCLHLAGARRSTALLAFSFLSLSPLHIHIEAITFQVWDGGLGTGLALAALAVVLWGERAANRPVFICGKAVLPALSFVVSPITGLAAIAASAVSTLCHHRRDGLTKPLLLLIACLVVAPVPWLLRNERVMHHAILLRDNLGLELAVANYPEAVRPTDMNAVFWARLAQVHPLHHPGVDRRLVAAGGEVAYAQGLMHSTVGWMRAHPADVAVIWGRHLREAIFPAPWMYRHQNTSHAKLHAAMSGLISLLALGSLVCATLRKEWRYLYLAIFIGVPVLLTMPFQPIVRYDWSIYPLCACLAVDFVVRTFVQLKSREFGGSQRAAIKPAYD